MDEAGHVYMPHTYSRPRKWQSSAAVKAAVQGCRQVFHLAAEAHGAPGAQAHREVNVGGAENVAAACLEAGVERLVHASTAGIYGLLIWFQGKSNVLRYGYFRNWMYWLQRITGLIAFLFIVGHVWGTRIQVLINEAVTKDNLFAHFAAQIDNPPILIFYVVGILASVIHLSNGIWLALITWGMTIGPRSQKTSSWVCAVIGLVLLVLSAQALRGFIAAGA